MLKLETKRVSEENVECSVAIDGKGDDILYECFYGIKAMFASLEENDPMMKRALIFAMIHDVEWLGDDAEELLGDRKIPLDALLGRKAMEGGIS